MAEESQKTWHMTAPQGRKWTPANGGASVTLDVGVWDREQKRWLNPDEINELAKKVGPGER